MIYLNFKTPSVRNNTARGPAKKATQQRPLDWDSFRIFLRLCGSDVRLRRRRKCRWSWRLQRLGAHRPLPSALCGGPPYSHKKPVCVLPESGGGRRKGVRPWKRNKNNTKGRPLYLTQSEVGSFRSLWFTYECHNLSVWTRTEMLAYLSHYEMIAVAMSRRPLLALSRGLPRPKLGRGDETPRWCKLFILWFVYLRKCVKRLLAFT